MRGAVHAAGRHPAAPYKRRKAPRRVVQVELGTLLLGACTVLHGGCSLPLRCLHGTCSQCERCCTVPAHCVFEHAQTHWNSWVYCFAWLHWRSNWVILGKGYISLFLFFNQYIFSCKLKICNQFLAICIGKSIFPKFFCRFPIENDNGVRVVNPGF